MDLLARLGLSVKTELSRVSDHPTGASPVAVQRDFEERHGGNVYTLADGSSVSCVVGSRAPVTFGNGIRIWQIGERSPGQRLFLDEDGVVYTVHEIEGFTERLGDSFDSWLAWSARDAARALPAPAPALPPDDSSGLLAALGDMPADPEVRFGTATSGELEALLDELGLSATSALLEAEAAYGGLVTRWIRVGPFQMLRDPDFAARRTCQVGGHTLVLVGQMHDALLFIAPDGAIFRVPFPLHLWRGEPRRAAATLTAWLKRCALVHQICERSAIRLEVACASASVVAAGLGAEPWPDAGEEQRRAWRSADAIVLEGADPFNAKADDGIVYVATTALAAHALGFVEAQDGCCRVASAPWPSTWAPVLSSRFLGAPAPALARMQRYRSPVVTREVRGRSEAPRATADASAMPLSPCWPDELGQVRRVDDGIEQIRTVAGEVVIVQRFVGEEEQQTAYTAITRAAECDPRWRWSQGALSQRLAEEGCVFLELAMAVENEFGGLRWRRRGAEGWLGLGASLDLGREPIRMAGELLLPLGEEGESELFLSSTGGVLRRARQAHAAIWHEGHRLRYIASSVAELAERVLRD